MLNIPSNGVILISGVPGSGKTTLSYEILKTYSNMLLLEETDIIRETLLGYNQYLANRGIKINEIYDHNVIMNYEMACSQCNIMKYSLRSIIGRQQRKGIPTIVNGVHVIPEILLPFLKYDNIVYITLYISTKRELQLRYRTRDHQKYSDEILPTVLNMNSMLVQKTEQAMKNSSNVFLLNTEDLTPSKSMIILQNILENYYSTNTSG